MFDFDKLNTYHSQSFRDRADAAAYWEAWTAAVLTRCGLYVLLNPWAINHDDHSKSFDLSVSTIHPQDFSDAMGSIPLEVKSVNASFKEPSTYPYDPVLVCSQNNFMKKWPGEDTTGRDFMIVSRKTGHMAWIPAGTKVTFGVEVFDRERGRMNKSVAVPKTALLTVGDYVKTFKVKHG